MLCEACFDSRRRQRRRHQAREDWGFSMMQAVPSFKHSSAIRCAADMVLLPISTKRCKAGSASISGLPYNCARLRSAGYRAMDHVEQGGANQTPLTIRCRNHLSTVRKTGGEVRSYCSPLAKSKPKHAHF